MANAQVQIDYKTAGMETITIRMTIAVESIAALPDKIAREAKAIIASIAESSTIKTVPPVIHEPVAEAPAPVQEYKPSDKRRSR